MLWKLIGGSTTEVLLDHFPMGGKKKKERKRKDRERSDEDAGGLRHTIDFHCLGVIMTSCHECLEHPPAKGCTDNMAFGSWVASSLVRDVFQRSGFVAYEQFLVSSTRGPIPAA